METLPAGEAKRVTAGGDGTGEPPDVAGVCDGETGGDWVIGTWSDCAVTGTEPLGLGRACGVASGRGALAMALAAV